MSQAKLDTLTFINRIIALPNADTKDVLNDIWEVAEQIANRCKKDDRPTPPDLGIGQSSFRYPIAIKNALVTPPPPILNYPPPEGQVSTCEEIATYLNHRYPGLHYTSDEIIVTSGATSALYLCFMEYLAKKTTENNQPNAVVVFEGAYPGYEATLNQLGFPVELIVVKTNAGFRPSVNNLRTTLLTYSQVTMVLLNYPNNPTGVALNEQEAWDLQALCAEFPHVKFIIDAAYESLTFESHYSLIDKAKDRSNIILIHSFSKAFCVPGLRAGFAALPASDVRLLKARQVNISGGLCHSSEQVIISILKLKNAFFENEPINEEACALVEWEKEYRAFCKAQTTFMHKKLTELGLTALMPEGGIFIFLDVSSFIGRSIPNKVGKKFESDHDVANFLLEKEALITIPGAAFKVNGHYLRLSCAHSQTVLETALKNLRQMMSLITMYPKNDRFFSLDDIYQLPVQGNAKTKRVMTNWMVLTGTGSTGKTTLINALKARFGSQVTFVHVDQEFRHHLELVKKNMTDQEYEKYVVSQDAFDTALKMRMDIETCLDPNAFCIFDRSLIDTLAYGVEFGNRITDAQRESIKQHLSTYIYKQVFHLGLVPLENDGIRLSVTEEQRVKSQSCFFRQYASVGYLPVRLGIFSSNRLESITRRVEMILSVMDEPIDEIGANFCLPK